MNQMRQPIFNSVEQKDITGKYHSLKRKFKVLRDVLNSCNLIGIYQTIGCL